MPGPRSRHGALARVLLSTCLLWTIAAACLGCERAGEPDGPGEPLAALLPARPGSHVIVVSFDALRPDALGAYGYPKPTSPHLDAFAKEAVLFENAYSVAPKTPTSFAAFFTGRRPTDVFRGWRLKDVPTLAELMRAAGYATAAFANNPQLVAERGFGRGFDTYRVRPGVGDPGLLAEASVWLAAHRERPVFLWLHWLDPHSPWVFRPASQDLYDEDYAGPYEKVAAQLLSVEDPDELARVRSLYDGEIRAVDRLFGRLQDRLRELGLYDDAIVIVTADHGEEFMEHGHLQHGWLTEENVRIPLMIRHPDRPHASRVRVRVSNLDFLPMVARLVGLPEPEGVVGRDPSRPDLSPRPLVLASGTERAKLAASLIRGDMKLIVYCGRRRGAELFDLRSDPLESENLADRQPSTVQSMERELFSLLGIDACDELVLEPSGEGSQELHGLSVEEIEALRELGYVE
jgi:arylsulfatase A-like enzyme